MTTSGSSDWTVNRTQIITRALRMLGVVGPGQVPTAEQISEAAESLDAMVKSWQNKHIHLWTRELVQKTLTASDEVTGSDGNIYTCTLSHTSAAGNKPVTGANWTTFWVRRGSTGSTWLTTTAYSSIGDFEVAADTIDVQVAFVRDIDDDTPLTIAPYTEYLRIFDKDSTGRPEFLFFDKQIPPRIYLAEQPDDANYVIHYLRVRRLEDFDDGGNTPDFPVRWINALVWNLLVELEPEYPLTANRRRDYTAKAEFLRSEAKGGDREVDNAPVLAGAYDHTNTGGRRELA